MIVTTDGNKTRTEWALTDPALGVNYIRDFIGNTGAFNDGQFKYHDELDVFECDSETFDWWDKVIADNQELNDRIAELNNKHGYDSIHDVICDIAVDLEDYASCVNQALNEFESRV